MPVDDPCLVHLILAGPEEFARTWRLDRRFTPAMTPSVRDKLCNGWRDALARSLLKQVD